MVTSLVPNGLGTHVQAVNPVLVAPKLPLRPGSRRGVRGLAIPEIIRPDRTNPFGVEAPWNGLVCECYVRNSDAKQRGNHRSQLQDEDLPRRMLELGYGVRVNDEQAMSGGRIESLSNPRKSRKVMQAILARVLAGEAQRIAVLELSRLSRDERRLDPAYIAEVIRDKCDGKVLTWDREYDLFDLADSRQYDLETMIAGWRRQDDNRNSMQGFMKYVQNIVAGRRPVTMPHRVRFGYRRVDRLGADGQVVRDASGRALRDVALDHTLAESMKAFRSACNTHRDLTLVCRELNRAGLRGPKSARPIGQQWDKAAVRLMLEGDIYVGIWRPFREMHVPEAWRVLAKAGFDPTEQRRAEPGLAWFTESEWAHWRQKFLGQKRSFSRLRKHEHPLLGLLACAACSEKTGETVYLVRDGVHPTIHGNEHYYRCPNGPKGLCSFTLGHYKATDALLNVLPEVKRRTTDVVTRIYDWAAGGNSIRLQQSIDAKRHRRQWIHENQIEPCKVAGVKPDPDAIIEHARLAEEISQLERELEALGAQTELMQRAAEVLSAFGGNIEGAMPLLNEDGQAIVWRALLAEVHMTGTGHGRARQVWVHSLRTAGEHFVKPIHYPEENGSGAGR